MNQLQTYTPPEALWRLADSVGWRTYTVDEVLKHIDDYGYSEEAEREAVKVVTLAKAMMMLILKTIGPHEIVCYYTRESNRIVSLNMSVSGVNYVVAIDFYVTNEKGIYPGYIRDIGIVEHRHIVSTQQDKPQPGRQHESQI